MPRTKKSKQDPVRQRVLSGTGLNGPADEVLTLPEAAEYLRLPEAEVLRLVDQQELPARRAANEWRFFKAAIQRWLSTSVRAREGIWAAAGSLKDDPYLEEMLKSIDRMRDGATTGDG
jgi:excisionase family DNA binding protein